MSDGSCVRVHWCSFGVGCCLGCTCGCMCSSPHVLPLEVKQASPLTPVLSLKSLIGPQSLEHQLFEHHCPPVFFPSLGCFRSPPFGFAGWLAGRKAPAHLLYRPREEQLRAKSVQNVKHRWPLTHKWVRGKRESLLSLR